MEPLSSHPLEELSFGLFSYLEGLPGFCSLAVEPRRSQPVTASALHAWHVANAPLHLPEDLASFLGVRARTCLARCFEHPLFRLLFKLG
jgi:hypothetical protein